MRFSQIKLYSFAAPFAVLPLLDITVSGVWDYMRGMEFRTFLAEIVTQVVSGVADAFIISAVSSLYAGLGI
jgi:hypothetical protein